MYSLAMKMAFMAHSLACIWFWIGNFPEESELGVEERTPTWLTAYAQFGTNNLNATNVGAQYSTSMYWTVATMTAVGYGDIFATTDSERVFSIIAQVMGASLFGFVIGNTSNILDTMDLHATYLNQKLSEVKAYMIERKFPKDLQSRVKTYYTYYLQKKSIFDEDLILDEVSSTLREQVVKEASKDLLRKFMLFEHEHAGFITAVFTKLKV